MSAEKRPKVEVERQVEAVLAGLRAAEPSAGFEARLLQGLAGRGAGAPGRAGRLTGSWFPVARRPALTAAVVCGVVLLAWLSAGHWRSHWREAKTPERQIAQGSARSAGMAPLTRPESFPARRERAMSGATGRVEPARGRGRRTEAVQSLAAAGEGRPLPAGKKNGAPWVSARLELAADADRVAEEDFRAPSQLAPPMPLTAQERRVRLMLRRGEKRNLAQLDPIRGVMEAGQEKAEQRAFFDPPQVQVDPFGGLLP